MRNTPDIEIRSCLEGAEAAEGLTVIIDIFRAGNTILRCLEGGAREIVPVSRFEEAHALKKEDPEALLLGEQGGLPPVDFDYGNSPAEVSRLSLRGKRVILRTSAGTQGIVYARKSEKIVIGTFANARALRDYIEKENPDRVSLVAMGNEAREPADEDEAFARYFRALLQLQGEGEEPDFSTVKEALLDSEGAGRLRRLGQQKDLDACLQLGGSRLVPVYSRETKSIT